MRGRNGDRTFQHTGPLKALQLKAPRPCMPPERVLGASPLPSPQWGAGCPATSVWHPSPTPLQVHSLVCVVTARLNSLSPGRLLGPFFLLGEMGVLQFWGPDPVVPFGSCCGRPQCGLDCLQP